MTETEKLRVKLYLAQADAAHQKRMYDDLEKAFDLCVEIGEFWRSIAPASALPVELQARVDKVKKELQ